MPLPKSCAECVFLKKDISTCQRHAPGTAFEPFETVSWPRVKPKTDRCGSGDTRGPGPVKCGRCIYWSRPGGKGIEPDYAGDKGEAWWRDSGYCVRYAPSPSGAERDEGAVWRCTNGTMDGCGDGEEAR